MLLYGLHSCFVVFVFLKRSGLDSEIQNTLTLIFFYAAMSVSSYSKLLLQLPKPSSRRLTLALEHLTRTYSYNFSLRPTFLSFFQKLFLLVQVIICTGCLELKMFCLSTQRLSSDTEITSSRLAHL